MDATDSEVYKLRRSYQEVQSLVDMVRREAPAECELSSVYDLRQCVETLLRFAKAQRSAKEDVMHALFVSLSTQLGNLRTPHVYLFDSEVEAEHFAVVALSEAGALAVTVLSPGRYKRPLSDGWITAAEVLEEFQDNLGASEYFHVYDVTDSRSATEERER